MEYEKQKFVNGQVLTAECLNRMEEGIKGACDAVPPACDATDCSKVLSHGENGCEWVDMPKGGSADAVLYTEQTLTDEQKAQARKNIGAASKTDIVPYFIRVDHYLGDSDTGTEERYEIDKDFNWDAMVAAARDTKKSVVCRVNPADGSDYFSEYTLQSLYVEDNYASFVNVEGSTATTLMITNEGNITALPFEIGGSGGGGVSVQPDWNQTDETAADFIKNKPFGDVPGDTLTWDGKTDGLEMLDLTESLGAVFYKICDEPFTIADITEGSSLVISNGVESSEAPLDPSGEGDVMEFGGLVVLVSFYAMSVPTDNFELEIDEGLFLRVPKKGVYSIWQGTYVSKLTFPGYTGFPVPKKVAYKYLPDAVILYIDSDKYLYATADTSDTSKRITKAYLQEVVKSGRTIWVDYIYLYLVTMVNLTKTAGWIVTTLETLGDLHTAEYVPATTE